MGDRWWGRTRLGVSCVVPNWRMKVYGTLPIPRTLHIVCPCVPCVEDAWQVDEEAPDGALPLYAVSDEHDYFWLGARWRSAWFGGFLYSEVTKAVKFKNPPASRIHRFVTRIKQTQPPLLSTQFLRAIVVVNSISATFLHSFPFPLAFLLLARVVALSLSHISPSPSLFRSCTQNYLFYIYIQRLIWNQRIRSPKVLIAKIDFSPIRQTFYLPKFLGVRYYWSNLGCGVGVCARNSARTVMNVVNSERKYDLRGEATV